MKKILLSSLLNGIVVLAITGCASTEAPQASNGNNAELTSEQIAKRADYQAALAAAKKEAGYRCEKVVPTGSRIGKRSCTTNAQRKKMREDAEKSVRDGLHQRGDLSGDSGGS